MVMTRRGQVTTWVALLGVCLSAAQLAGLYARPDLVLVPLSRLLQNLERQVADNPEDGDSVHLLARTHAMAYAWRVAETTDVAVHRTYGKNEVYSGTPGQLLPFRRDYWSAGVSRAVRSLTQTPKREVVDRESVLHHLDRAIELYRRAAFLTRAERRSWSIDVVRLGLAWCLVERGEEEEAARLLRAIVRRQSVRASSRGHGPPGPFLAAEATHDLLELLKTGRVKLAHPNEIEAVQYVSERMDSVHRAVTPLAVDLTSSIHNAKALIDPTAAVTFDLDGTGRQIPWTWIRPTAAWLVWDPDHTGTVRDALQLFGNRTFNLILEDGFAALRLLDDDGNGLVEGDELAGLALWRDQNVNGISEPGEVESLRHHGIAALANSATHDPKSNYLVARGGVVKSDGSKLDLWDLILDPAPLEDPEPTE